MHMKLPLINLRKKRTDAFVALVMGALDDIISADDRYKIFERLYSAIYDAEIEILTEEDRRIAGMEPRNEMGWTNSELRILETIRLEKMMASTAPLGTSHDRR